MKYYSNGGSRMQALRKAAKIPGGGMSKNGIYFKTLIC